MCNLWRWFMAEVWTPIARTLETWTPVTDDQGGGEPEPETPDYSAQYDFSDANKTGFLFFAGWP
jgi:hypothetical protein